MQSPKNKVKIIIVGESGVGKTCIALHFISGKFSDKKAPTIAAGFCREKIKIGDKELDLSIWDTAGQEVYRGLTSQYYRDAKIALIVFDLSNISTLNSVGEWHKRVSEINKSNVVCMLVGNKSDLPNRQVTREMVEAKASEIKALYQESSASTGDGIKEIFYRACEEYIRTAPPDSFHGGVNVRKGSNDKSSGCDC